MKLLNLPQGSAAWHAHRATARNASEAAVMLGEHPDVKRNEMLAVRATGIDREVSEYLQRIFDRGHEFEALARPIAEGVLGEELYPMVGTDDSGQYSASLDGLTMDDATAWEHKWLSSLLRAVMFDGCAGADLPLYHQIQMEQQCMVSGAIRVLFTASEWDTNGELIEARHCWYTPNPTLRARIIAGWGQFDLDVAAYVPAPAIQYVVAQPVAALPALAVQVDGTISIRENFRAFEAAVRDFLEHKLIREPKTDQDFVDLDQQIKAMKDAEAALDGAEAQMLAQIQTVDSAKRTKDMLSKLVRENRLMAEKLLTSEKERRRAEIVQAARAVVTKHYADINESLGQCAIAIPPTIAADLAAAIKGLRTLSSLQNAVDTAVATIKIAANERADKVRAAVTAFEAEVGTHAALFPDRVTLCMTKAPEDLRNLMNARISEHQRREQARIDADRECIRKEEQERADREARERIALEQATTNTPNADEASAAAEAITKDAGAAPPPAEPIATVPRTVSLGGTARVPVGAIGGNAAAPAADAPRMKLGDINAVIAPLSISADGLATLGFHAVATERSSKLYAATDFPAICRVLAQRLTVSATTQQAAA